MFLMVCLATCVLMGRVMSDTVQDTFHALLFAHSSNWFNQEVFQQLMGL